MLDRSEVGKRGYLNENFRLFHLKTILFSGNLSTKNEGTAFLELGAKIWHIKPDNRKLSAGISNSCCNDLFSSS